MITGYKEKIPEDVALVFASEIKRQELVNAIQQLAKVSCERPKNILAELNIYRKYVHILVNAYIELSDGLKKATMQIDRCTEVDYDRGNKRWTNEEDETLINLVCEGKTNIHKISTILGRSPGAIQTHISYLVGRKRITQEVAGKFIGFINGITAEAEICGTVYK